MSPAPLLTASVGVATVDVTPAAGHAMSGFVARTHGATGTHDALTVRALCVDDTAVVSVDVIGLDEDLCAEVRARCPLPDDGVVVHAIHTHGGPTCVPRRLGGSPSPGQASELAARLADACVDAVSTAAGRRRPATLRAGYGSAPGVARNRRRPDGPVDPTVPVVLALDDGGRPVAVLTSYACHPVVLGADNTQWTADYPGVVRTELESRYPGAVAVFLTGCAGDANTGHPATASMTTAPSTSRTFVECRRVGRRVSSAAALAPTRPVTGHVGARRGRADLRLLVPHLDDVRRDRVTWRHQAGRTPDDAGRALLDCWADWADHVVRQAEHGPVPACWTGDVTLLAWGTVRIAALPGEPFAATGVSVRQTLTDLDDDRVVLVVGYSDGCPGYLAPSSEYALGGYEVEEAHRYYGMPGPFAPGSAEELASLAVALDSAVGDSHR